MILSICMMVKDEEKKLEGCLKSLLPLMQSVESELIIVDTGSEDKTVEIARKYTEKLYFHKWNNNFSEMRNISIKYASGKWIFIIDADEVIEDPTEIIVFLKSEYCNKYKSALVNVKNLTSDLNNEFVMMVSPRLFFNDGTFEYKGIVHNKPVYKRPTITLNTVLIHSGYDSTDQNLMEKKFLRTSRLLKDEIAKSPEDIYYNYQLSVSYSMHKDYKDALEQIEKTYNMLQRSKADRKEYIYIYFQFASCSLQSNDMKNYEKVKQICKEGISIEKEYIDLYFLLGKIYILESDFCKAEKYYLRFLELALNYETLNVRHNGLIEMYCLNRVEEAYYDLSFLYYKKKEYENSLEIIKKITDKNYIIKSTDFTIDEYIILEKYEELRKYYDKNLSILETEHISQFLEILESHIIKLTNDKRIRIIEVFSGDEDTYLFLNKIRTYFINGNYNFLNVIDKFINKIDLNIQPEYFGDLIYYKMKLNEQLSIILTNVSESSITRYIRYICKKYDDFCDVVQIYLSSMVYSENNFAAIRFNKLLRKFILILNSENKEFFKMNFLDYVDEGVNYINTIYSSYVIDNEMIYDVKNEEDAFFIFIDKANKIKSCDEREYIRYLRKALAIYPCMKLGIEILLQEFEKEIKNENNEFEKYKIQIKDAIKDFIENGNLENAELLVSEYENIVKNDMEIVLFKSQISIKRLKEVNSSKYRM